MKSIKTILALAIMLSSEILLGQSPSFFDLTFGADSTTSPYKSSSSNYISIRSKRGAEPVKPTTSGDSIKTFNIQKIILVFSEVSSSDITNRDEYNQERWENLMATYPEFFQAKTTYKNVCQCNPEAANPDFKQAQGFYIYYTPKASSEPKKEIAKETPVVKKEEPKKEVEVAKVDPPKKSEPKKEEPKKEIVKEEPKKEVEVAKVEAPKKTEPKKEEPKKEEPKKEVVKEEPKKEIVKEPEVIKKEEPKKEVVAEDTGESEDAEADAKKKSTVPSKPRRAKDPKACRSACYGSGEADLNAFFRDNIVLTKKMKKDEVDLKLQLNFDGTVKKVIILGENVELNKLVEEAAKTMVWNASVKGGLTIKSEVRMILKYDKELKGLKANELIVNPRLGPKCVTCTSDSELFPN